MRFVTLCFALFLAMLGNVQAAPAVVVSQNWVRATAPGQEVGAAYMTLTSQHDVELIKAESPSAGSVEIHSMTMDNGVMKMRMLDTLKLPAGKPVDLAPGGFHLMLFDLKQPLQAGAKVEFTLHFKDAHGKTSELKISSPVKAAE